jgi:Zn-dependent protease
VVFGYTRFEPLNAALAILGGVSLVVAVFNLLAVPPLDGSTAWGIVPELIERTRQKKTRSR